MVAMIDTPEFADTYLIKVLDEFGLAIKYTRAEGNTLYRHTDNGDEIGAFDCASGFGSLIFGHNNPEIIHRAKELMDAQTPVHAQFAGWSPGVDVADALNPILRRELDTTERFFALFGNSGAEAIEISLKHAELDRGMRIADIQATISANLDRLRATGTTPHLTPQARDQLGLHDDNPLSAGTLAAAIERTNAAVADQQPLFLVIEGGFHGKLASSVQLTHNHEFRLPFKALAAQARFVPRDSPELMRKIVSEERAVLLDVSFEGDEPTVVEHEFPVFGAFLVEPIAGEAGIWPLSPGMASEIRAVCDETGAPLISDEIQSGMGRSGDFLAGTAIGLQPDYVVLAKSLGGGLFKTGVVLVRESRYHPDFELIHTSTYGKDGLSSQIALKVIEMLEADEGAAYSAAAERGEAALSMLEAVQADFPDVVKDVRGRGLMLGVEFQDQGRAGSPQIREWVEQEALGFVIGGYLLHRHNVRIFTTASSLNTMRFEPSIYLSDAEIQQFDTAIRDVCEILRDEAADRFSFA